MRGLFFLLLFTRLSAQDLAKLTPSQQRLYASLTQSVSAPCCNNALPVAFHESAMALHVRSQIFGWVAAGRDKKEIWQELESLRLGDPAKSLIFTVPQKNMLGLLFWFLPVALILAGLLLAMSFQRQHSRPAVGGMDAPVDPYLPWIRARLARYL